MSWYRETGYTWTRRWSLTVDNTGGGAGAIDISGAIPSDLEDFWNLIDTSGNELRITDPDGMTKLSYNIESFSKTNRTGTIEVDNYDAPGTGLLHLFLYAGATGAPSGAAAAFVPASAKTLYIATCGPPRVGYPALRERPGDTRPRARLAKASDETIKVGVDFAAMLAQRVRPFQNRLLCDEIDYASYVVTLNGASQAGMITAASPRFFDGRFISLDLKSGTDGSDYTVVPTVRTTDGLVVTPRAILQVRDVDEA